MKRVNLVVAMLHLVAAIPACTPASGGYGGASGRNYSGDGHTTTMIKRTDRIGIST